MVVSGLFFTLGSLAFIRAMHDDPPMRALFPNIYHMQSDELLGSWLFLLGTVIFIPYCMIFVAGTTSKLLYLGLLVVSVIVTFGTYLFVRACYPTEEEVRISLGYSPSDIIYWLIIFINFFILLLEYENNQAHISSHMLLLSLAQVDEEAHAKWLARRGVVHLLGDGPSDCRQLRYLDLHTSLLQSSE